MPAYADTQCSWRRGIVRSRRPRAPGSQVLLAEALKDRANHRLRLGVSGKGSGIRRTSGTVFGRLAVWVMRESYLDCRVDQTSAGGFMYKSIRVGAYSCVVAQDITAEPDRFLMADLLVFATEPSS